MCQIKSYDETSITKYFQIELKIALTDMGNQNNCSLKTLAHTL